MPHTRPVADLQTDDYVTVTGTDQAGRVRTRRGYVAQVSADTVLLTAYPGAEGATEALTVGPRAVAAVSAAPDSAEVVLYRDAVTGAPAAVPGAADIAAGTVVRDHDREQRTRERIIQLPAVRAGDSDREPAGRGLAYLSPVDRARVAVAVEDHAPAIYHSRLLRPDPSGPPNLADIGRYLAEGVLADLSRPDRYGFGVVWEAVEEYAREHDHLLARTDDQVAGQRQARLDRCTTLAADALKAFRAQQYATARSLLIDGELLDPDYRTANGRSWHSMRTVIDQAQAQDPPVTAAPAAPSTAEQPRAAAVEDHHTPAVEQVTGPAPASRGLAAAPLVPGQVVPLHEAPVGTYGRVSAMGPDGSRWNEGRPQAGYLVEAPRVYTGGAAGSRKYRGVPLLSFGMHQPSGGGRTDAIRYVGMLGPLDTTITVLAAPADAPLDPDDRLWRHPRRRLPNRDVRTGDVVDAGEWGLDRDLGSIAVLQDPAPGDGDQVILTVSMQQVPRTITVPGYAWVGIDQPVPYRPDSAQVATSQAPDPNPAPADPVTPDAVTPEQIRSSIRAIAVNTGPVLEDHLNKIGQPHLAATVVEDAARRYALGHPVVRQGRGEYLLTCPLPDCGRMYGDIPTVTAARSMWFSHVEALHPGYLAQWPDTEWPVITSGSPRATPDQARMPTHLDDPRFGLAGARRINAYAVDLATGQIGVGFRNPVMLILAAEQVAALETAGDTTGMVYGVIVRRSSGAAAVVGPFINGWAAWSWWQVPQNKAVRSRDSDVLFTVLAAAEQEAHPLYLGAEAYEILAAADEHTPRELLLWAAGTVTGWHGSSVVRSWTDGTGRFSDSPNGGGNTRPQGANQNRWMHHDSSGFRLSHDAAGEQVIFRATWRQVSGQVGRDTLPAQIVQRLETAATRRTAATGDRRQWPMADIGSPEHQAEQQRWSDVEQESRAAAAAAWAAVRPAPGLPKSGPLPALEEADQLALPLHIAAPVLAERAHPVDTPTAAPPTTLTDEAAPATLVDEQPSLFALPSGPPPPIPAGEQAPAGPTLYDITLRDLQEHSGDDTAVLDTVPAAEIAPGAYARLTGLLADGRTTTVTGYVIAAGETVDGYEGWVPAASQFFTVAADPDALDGVDVALPHEATVTILQPAAGLPAGAQPWRQPAGHARVVAHLAEIGLELEQTTDSLGQPCWQIPGVDREFHGPNAADHLLGLLLSEGTDHRRRPLLRQEFIDEAIAAGRWAGTEPRGPMPLRHVRSGAHGTITGQVDGVEQTVQGRLGRWWTRSHRTTLADTVTVVMWVPNPRIPEGAGRRERVVSVQVPATGAVFTVTDPPAPEPVSQRAAATVEAGVDVDAELSSPPATTHTHYFWFRSHGGDDWYDANYQRAADCAVDLERVLPRSAVTLLDPYGGQADGWVLTVIHRDPDNQLLNELIAQMTAIAEQTHGGVYQGQDETGRAPQHADPLLDLQHELTALRQAAPAAGPPPADHLLRIAAGQASAPAAARDYLTATHLEHTAADVADLAGRWQRQIDRLRARLLGDRLDAYFVRVEQIERSPMSRTAAQTAAFEEILPDGHAAMRALLTAVAVARISVVPAPKPGTVLPLAQVPVGTWGRVRGYGPDGSRTTREDYLTSPVRPTSKRTDRAGAELLEVPLRFLLMTARPDATMTVLAPPADTEVPARFNFSCRLPSRDLRAGDIVLAGEWAQPRREPIIVLADPDQVGDGRVRLDLFVAGDRRDLTVGGDGWVTVKHLAERRPGGHPETTIAAALGVASTPAPTAGEEQLSLLDMFAPQPGQDRRSAAPSDTEQDTQGPGSPPVGSTIAADLDSPAGPALVRRWETVGNGIRISVVVDGRERGAITQQRGPGAGDRIHWLVGGGGVVREFGRVAGDYLDAERLLLAATMPDLPPDAAVAMQNRAGPAQPPWLAGVILGEPAPSADGARTVLRRTSRAFTRVHVESMHPQYGPQPRGFLRLTSGRGEAPVWALVDGEAAEHDPVTGTYLQAETALLDATAGLDVLDHDLEQVAQFVAALADVPDGDTQSAIAAAQDGTVDRERHTQSVGSMTDAGTGPASTAVNDSTGEQHEPVRAAADGALADESGPAVSGPAGSGGVLHRAGGAGGADDRGPGAQQHGPGTGRGAVSGPGQAPGDGPGRGAERRDASPAAGDVAADAIARFRPLGQQDLAPAGEKARIEANLAAIRVLQQPGPVGGEQQRVLARWSGWGAVPALFDQRPGHADRYAAERAQLLALVGQDGYRAARRTTLNAHYTDAAYVQVIWQTVQRLGFTAGTVLEPGCGSGTFLGFAPESARPVGVELDPTTAAIAQALYPHARILAESFADTRIQDGSVDLVIGNVPFGKQKLVDPVYNPGRVHPIHNHFIVKSLHAVRPGGLVALITSRHTLDGTDAAHRQARQQMAELAELVAAVRLPTGAHQQAAGTEVVTDLLILRRRTGDPEQASPLWLRTRTIDLPHASRPGTSETFEVNAYFLDQPAMVLGTLAATSGRYGPVLAVQPAPGSDTAETLAAALARATPAEVPSPAPVPAAAIDPVPVTPTVAQTYQEGLFLDLGDGRFQQIRDGRPVRHEPPQTQIAELRALIGLRDTIVALLDEEATHRDDTARMSRLRAQLNSQYDAYVRAHGHVNRFKLSTGTKTDRETGEVTEVERRIYPRMGGFRDDPFFPYVAALEDFNDDTGEATKAEVFVKRVIAVPTPVDRVDTAADALVICWDRHNQVRLDVIAGLLGLDSTQQARYALGMLVFEEPGTGELIRKAEYLSGNVRRKLAAARAAAAGDDRFAVNVQALLQVIPRDLAPAEIGARLGSPWISAGVVQQFLHELLEDDTVTVTVLAGKWAVNGGDKTNVLSHTVWGAGGRLATDLAASVLNNHTIEITTKVRDAGGERTIRDVAATTRAQAKAEQIDARFRTWLWEDPDRAATLSRLYNDRFNARVFRSYDGEHIDAPGMSTAYELRPHQMAAVARIREQQGVGLFHGTGLGKTLEMIVGGMELRRLGLANKPCYVVPKGVLGQFRREFQAAYPLAKILAADSSDLQGDKRRRFVARCSTGDWDAIIISHNAFKSIPVSKPVQAAFQNRIVDRLQQHLAAATDGSDRAVKDIETQIANLEEHIAELLEKPGDPGVEFERTGIDYLFIDEAQTYKNNMVISAIPDLALEGNAITADLAMKLDYLRSSGRRRVVTLATATPIDNAPSELLTMVKYAAPHLLEELGLETDDEFHSAFIQPRRRVEMSPDGSGFRSRVRYSRYVNVPELKQQLLYAWADVKFKEQVDLGEPAIVGGKPQILTNDAPTELRAHLVTLGKRAKDYTSGRPQQRLTTKGEWKDDNILWISTDGRKASLDLRLADLATDEPQKIDVTADWVAATWREHRDDVYYRPDGTEEPLRGSLQLVFCDLGVPSQRWNVYEALRDALAERGVPAEQIRFAQDAKSLRDRALLDQDARDGKIAVLIGSRAGLGTGRNIQRRVISVVQLDPVWKQSLLEQSLGRGKRQGNANTAIHHVFVVTVGSYDPFLWQKVEDKTRFTRQMLDPADTTRVIDVADDDGEKINPSVMFAVAAGQPDLVQLDTLEQTVNALRMEQVIWHDVDYALRTSVEQDTQRIAVLRQNISDLDTVLATRRDTRGDAFTMTVGRTRHDKRAAAGAELARQLPLLLASDRAGRPVPVGVLGGIEVTASVYLLDGGGIRLAFTGIPGNDVTVDAEQITALTTGGQDPVGLIRRLENKLATADQVRDNLHTTIAKKQTNIERARARIGQPFPQQADLDQYSRELTDLHRKLNVADITDPTQQPADDITTPATGTGAEQTPTAASAPTTAPATPEPDVVPPLPEAPRERPATPDAVAGQPTTSATARLADLLHQRGVTDPQRRWLAEMIRTLAASPRTAQVVTANDDYENAHLALARDIEQILFAVIEDRDDVDLYAKLTGPDQAAAFVRAVSAYLYESVADHDQQDDPAVQADSGPDEPDRAADGLPETLRRRRGHDFYPPADILAQIPPLYGTEGQPPADQVIYLHYFGGSIDYWLVEYDPQTGEAFGYGGIGDPDDFEWGYIWLPELEKILHGLVIIERDLHWNPVPAADAGLRGRRAPRREAAAVTGDELAATTTTSPVADSLPSPAVPADTVSTAVPEHRGAGAPVTAPTSSEPLTPVEPPAPKHRHDQVEEIPAVATAPTRPVPPDLQVSQLARLTGGQPYTSTKRIRGPLRDVKVSCNALLRTPGATRKAGEPLLATIEAVKQVTVDTTDPVDLLLWTAALSGQAHAAMAKLNRHADGGMINMLSGVIRSADTLAADLIATARKTNRWQRLFDQPPPDLTTAGAIVASPAKTPAVEDRPPADNPAAAAPSQDAAVPGSTEALAAARPATDAVQGELALDDTAIPDTAATPGPPVPANTATAAVPPDSVAGPATAADPDPEVPVMSTVPAEPVARKGPYLVRDGGTLWVRGTKPGPAEQRLRDFLKANDFGFRGELGWRYTGPLRDRDKTAAAVERWLAANMPRRVVKPFTPTGQQQAILDHYRLRKTIKVPALAGTGKTSTLVALADSDPTIRIAYLAFNSSIALEADSKFGDNVTARTFHSFARTGLANHPISGKLKTAGAHDGFADKWAASLNIPEVTLGHDAVDEETVARFVMTTVRTYRNSSDYKLTAEHLPEALRAGTSALAPIVLRYAEAAWADKTSTGGKLPFVHDDYLKIWALTHPRLPYDVLFFDEAQDVNGVQAGIVRAQQEIGTQVVAVGDSFQAIYGFRGAHDALDRWPVDVELPLTQSWRFGPAIAALGNQVLRALGSSYQLEGNPNRASAVGEVTDPDGIIARTNAAAVAAVFAAFDEGRSVALAGGSTTIEEIAQAAIDLQAGRRTRHPELAQFSTWKDVVDFVEKDEDAQSLRAFVRLVQRRGARQLLDMAADLVDEETPPQADGSPAYDVMVTTAHKSKGLEFRRVLIADDFPQPQINTETGAVTLPDPETMRLIYVTITRAMDKLDPGSLDWVADLDQWHQAGLLGRRAPVAVAAQDTTATTEQAPQPEHDRTAPAAGPADVVAPAALPTAEAPAGAPDPTTTDQLPTPAPAATPVPAPAVAAAPDEPAVLSASDLPAAAATDPEPPLRPEPDTDLVPASAAPEPATMAGEPASPPEQAAPTSEEDPMRVGDMLATVRDRLRADNPPPASSPAARPEPQPAPAPAADSPQPPTPLADPITTAATGTAGIDEVDLSQIRVTVIDLAAEFYGRSPQDGIARTATELSRQHLPDLTDRYGLGPVAAAAADVIHRDESLLFRTEQQRAAAQAERAGRSQMFAQLIEALVRGGEYQQAAELTRQAHQHDPTSPTFDWGQVHAGVQQVGQAHLAATEAAAAARRAQQTAQSAATRAAATQAAFTVRPGAGLPPGIRPPAPGTPARTDPAPVPRQPGAGR